MTKPRSAVRRASARLRTPLRRSKLTEREIERAEGLTWFVLATPPQRERHCEAAIEKLGKDGMVAFTPLEHRYRRYTRFRPQEMKRYNEPAYPRYVFLGVRPPKNQPRAGLPWHEIEHITFISGFLADPQGRPVTIGSEGIIQIMKASQTPLFDQKQESEAPAFVEVIAPGEEIKVISGILSGRHFIVARVESDHIEVEGAGAAIKIPQDFVRKAG